MSAPDAMQRIVLGALLEAHPRMLGHHELAAQPDGANVREAVQALSAAGW
jgi:hypothetical protein